MCVFFMYLFLFIFFFSSRRRHTRCALVTGVQTCALPIFHQAKLPSSPPVPDAALRDLVDTLRCHLARVCNQANKAAVNVLHAGLRQRTEFGTETPRQIRFTRKWRRLYDVRTDRSAGRRVGKECVSACRSRGWLYNKKTKKTINR